MYLGDYIGIHEQWIDDAAKAEIYDQYIKNEMHNLREEILARISQIVHPKYAGAFLKFVAYGVQECDKDAEKIADEFNFNQKELAAIEDNVDLFTEIEKEEHRSRKVEYLYERI